MTKASDTILFLMPEPGGFHPTAWREDGVSRQSETDFSQIVRMVQTAERGKFHGAFFADTLAVGFQSSDISAQALSHTAKGSRWEPITLLAALATCSRHIGLLATASTTYSEPYNIARMFASLDHLSNGRAGWNVVTTAHPKAVMNFGGGNQMDHALRYERGQEFYDVVAGLWDSWEDDAFMRDTVSGRYFDPQKLHALDFRGSHFSVAGPLNMARPPQGHPVIAQAGSSPAGRAFGAANADVIYTMQAGLGQGKSFYEEVKDQAAEAGRDPEHLKILQAMVLLVGRSQAHAEEKLARLDALVDPIVGMDRLRAVIKADLSAYPLDGPVPDIAEDSASKSSQKYYLDMARRDNLTVRQLMQVTARSGTIAGTAETIADMFQEWIEGGAADGFNLTFADEFESLEIFVDDVVPELQRRGLFQTRYRGTTLREHLGIPRPVNRFT